MNLRSIANASTSIINPNVPVTIKKYTGYTQDAGLNTTVTYSEINTTAQVQPVSSEHLQHIDGYTSGTDFKAFYFNNDLHGVSAPNGNDFIVWAGNTYKVVELTEGWYSTSGWSKVIARRQ